MSTNKVDIVIPVHNCFDYVQALLDSIFITDLSKLGKIIVSDDFSTEGDLNDLLSKYNDDRITFVKPPKRSYYSGNINYAFNFVTEKYFMILSSDTKILTKDWLNSFILEFEKYPDVGIAAPCYCNYEQPFPVLEFSIGNFYIGGAVWFMKTELFKNMNGFREDGKYVHWHSDFEFIDRVIENNLKISKFPIPICHRGGASRQYLPEEIKKTRYI